MSSFPPCDAPLPGFLTADALGGHRWRAHAPNRTGIRCGAVLIAGQYRGIMFQGNEPEYPPAQVEILSEQHLRTTLGYAIGICWRSHS
jgi:hypothetical protein